MLLNLPRNTTLYSLGKTDTYRAASSSLFKNPRAGFKGFGTNHQNIEKSLRRLYYADDGYVLNQRDQSGAEALIVAKLAPKGHYDDLFKYGIKPHVYVALRNFLSVWSLKCVDLDIDVFTRTPIKDLPSTPGWDILNRMIIDSDEWAPHERYYFIAKQMCHSGNYDIGVGEFIMNTLAKSRGTIALSREQGSEYLGNYRGLFPEILEWHDIIRRQVKETRMLFNLFGHPWIYTAEIEEDRMKDCFAFIPQSTVGVITHIAVTKTQTFIEKHRRRWHILNNNHDSFMVASPENEWEECQYKMKEYINAVLRAPSGEEFQMKSEGQTGRNWGPWKAKKNEDGLKKVNI